MTTREWLGYFCAGLALAFPLIVLWDHATRWGDEAFRKLLYAQEDRDHA